MANGCAKSKLILGIPAYGRTFTLADPEKHDIGDAISGPGEPGPLTLSSGFLGFHEVSYCSITAFKHLFLTAL